MKGFSSAWNTALFTVILFSLSFASFSQGVKKVRELEYIVRDTGKELGSIQFNAITKEIYFKADSAKKWKIEDRQRVLAFKDERNVYSKEVLNDSEIFLIQLAIGEVSLFEIGDSLFVKSNDELIIINESNLYQTLEELYASKPTWRYNKERLKSSKSYLVHLIKGYNRSDQFKSAKKTKGFNFQTNYSTYFLRTSANSNNQSLDLDPVASYTFGLKLEYPSFKGTSTMISFNFFNQHEHTTDLRGGVSQESQMVLIGVEPRFYIRKFFIEAGLVGGFTIFSANRLVRVVSDESEWSDQGMNIGFTYGFGATILDRSKTKTDLFFKYTGLDAKSLSAELYSIGFYAGF